MRNRRELKTTTMEGFDYEDEGDEVSAAEDSGEDWQPEKAGDAGAVAGKMKGLKVAPAKKATPAKRKAPANKGNGGKKAKKESSDEDDNVEDEEVEDDDVEDDSDLQFSSDSEESEDEVKNGTTKKRYTKKEGCDPNTLYVKKMDLKNGLNDEQNLLLWKRDGSCLLQRFEQIKTDNKDDYIFTSTTVYSVWEDRRKEEYFEVKTKSTGKGLVTIVDKEEFAKFIEESKTYEKDDSEDENQEGECGDNSSDKDGNEEESFHG